jgi:ankyrin repeat protein
VAESTHIAAFNYAIKLQKDKIAHTLWQHAENNHTFIKKALINAVAAEEAEVVYQLIKKYHADPHALPFNYSVLNIALKKRHFLLLDWLLLAPELELNVQGEERRTLLHCVIGLKNYPQEQRIQLIKRLLAEGADCNAADVEGRTPLMQSSQFKCEELVSLLLQQSSIDVNVCDKAGKNALTYAVEAGAFTIVEKLLMHDIDVADRVSAFNLVLKQNQKEDIANLLLQSVSGQQEFVDQALTQAITNNLPNVAYKLIKDGQVHFLL